MVDIYQINQKALLKLTEIKPGSWIAIQLPDKCNFTIMSNIFELPATVLDEISDPDEMARIEFEDTYTLFVLRVLMVPTFIASVYGMNVKLPFAGHPLGFMLVMAGSVVLTLGTFLVFKLKRYF